MPDHVKKILNRSYLGVKLYNGIVLQLKQKIRFNGLDTPDETILVQLNAVDANTAEQKKKQNQRGYCFHCGRYGH